MWTLFWDMHSGGGAKEKNYDKIYIEAPEDEAIVVFYNMFGHNPNRVSCTCCGEDYSISESETLEQASAYHRNCEWGYFRPDGTRCSKDDAWVLGKGTKKGYTERYIEKQEESRIRIRGEYNTKKSDKWGLYMTVAKYVKQKDVLVIRATAIKPEQRKGEVPKSGYVWVD